MKVTVKNPINVLNKEDVSKKYYEIMLNALNIQFDNSYKIKI